MPSTILVSGAGQLGSRHLQGLASSVESLTILVHDPSSDSLARAEARWHEMRLQGGQKTVNYVRSLAELPERIDVAIVATAADVRPEVVNQIARRTDVRNWVLEKVLAQSEPQATSIVSDVGVRAGAWVNTPRRLMKWHQLIRDRVQGRSGISLSVSGGQWGLACNSIHFLDLLQWWTGASLTSVDCSELRASWTPAKRPGYWEVAGTLRAVFSDGSLARLSTDDGLARTTLRVRVGDAHWTIDEAAGSARAETGEEVAGRLEFQSELTGSLIDRVLRDGRCDLPTLAKSAELHAVFLNALLDHWNAQREHPVRMLPIT